ncbi:hypothetical protein [Kutzneria chonburiensis]|nr:hypothetical protein [Kutzneria chonburiensis]
MAKKALVVAVTATGMLVIGAPAFAAAAPAGNPFSNSHSFPTLMS